jgi:hypothetical protein
MYIIHDGKLGVKWILGHREIITNWHELTRNGHGGHQEEEIRNTKHDPSTCLRTGTGNNIKVQSFKWAKPKGIADYAGFRWLLSRNSHESGRRGMRRRLGRLVGDEDTKRIRRRLTLINTGFDLPQRSQRTRREDQGEFDTDSHRLTLSLVLILATESAEKVRRGVWQGLYGRGWGWTER